MFPPTMTREDQVRQFIKASKEPNFAAVWNCMAEEFIEMNEAAAIYQETQDRPEACTPEEIVEARANFVKEVADVQYVLSQLAIFYNIDLQSAFNRVAANNMTKVVDGKVIYRETDGKVLKPEGYVKADMRGL